MTDHITFSLRTGSDFLNNMAWAAAFDYARAEGLKKDSSPTLKGAASSWAMGYLPCVRAYAIQ